MEVDDEEIAKSDSESSSSSSAASQDDTEDAQDQRMAALLSLFSPEQLARYEHFRRSHFVKSRVKAVVEATLEAVGAEQHAAAMGSERVLIVLGGAAKMFAGEVVEGARLVMEERGEKGAIQPRHIRESFRRLRREGKVPFVAKGV